MSDIDELYIDLSSDPEAVKPGWERSRAVTLSLRPGRLGGKRRAFLKGLNKPDSGRADTLLKRFD